MPKSTILAFLFLSTDSAMNLEEIGLCFTCIPRSLEELGLHTLAHPRCFGLWQLSLPTCHNAASF